LGRRSSKELHRCLDVIRRALLVCGILASLLYAGMNVFIAGQWEGYSSASQTVSELSAIGAPTRALWVRLGIVYTLLMAAFGWGIWRASARNRPLLVSGVLLAIYGVLGLFWPPMHLRAVLASGGATLTDTLHLVWAMLTVVLMVSAIGFASTAFERGFRRYSIATVLTLLVFGTLTTLDAPSVSANLPTPWIGVWERVNIAAFLLWVIVFALHLWPVQHSRGARDAGVSHGHIEAI